MPDKIPTAEEFINSKENELGDYIKCISFNKIK